MSGLDSAGVGGGAHDDPLVGARIHVAFPWGEEDGDGGGAKDVDVWGSEGGVEWTDAMVVRRIRDSSAATGDKCRAVYVVRLFGDGFPDDDHDQKAGNDDDDSEENEWLLYVSFGEPGSEHLVAWSEHEDVGDSAAAVERRWIGDPRRVDSSSSAATSDRVGSSTYANSPGDPGSRSGGDSGGGSGGGEGGGGSFDDIVLVEDRAYAKGAVEGRADMHTKKFAEGFAFGFGHAFAEGFELGCSSGFADALALLLSRLPPEVAAKVSEYVASVLAAIPMRLLSPRCLLHPPVSFCTHMAHGLLRPARH
jgi:hypothetical protein